MDHIERLYNILSESKMVWFLLRNMENIASSVGNIAQYRFSLSRKGVQWTSSLVNNYGYESERRQEKIYFRLYRSISFFTGFVERPEQGLQQQNKKKEQYEHLLRKYRDRFPDADKNQLITKFNSLRTNFRKELKRIKDSGKKWYWSRWRSRTNVMVFWRNWVSHRWGGTVYVAKYYSDRGRRRTGIWQTLAWRDSISHSSIPFFKFVA